MYRLVINQPAEGDNADKPQDTEEEGDPVQVPLDDGGGADGGGHPPAEQVRQAAALTLVQQDEQDHHETRNDQDNGKPDDHLCYPSPAEEDLCRQLTIPADLSELAGVEASASDQGTVDVRLRHDRGDVARLNGPAI